MKLRRSEVRRQANALPELKFENQSLTSYAGLVIFQQLFALLDLKARFRECFRHLADGKIFGPAVLFLQMVVHVLLGFRELRDSRAYRDDPLVKRILGLQRLPDVATLSRMLQKADEKSIDNLRRLLMDLTFERLARLGLACITLDFDGSVQSTRRHAEGTAVGYNKKRKGTRSYYPLFCTIAQTAQVLDFLHRSGNVHDSKGAREFIWACVEEVRHALPGIRIEVRMDSAFFSDEIVSYLQQADIAFTLSVPFERFCQLKGLIEARRRWQPLRSVGFREAGSHSQYLVAPRRPIHSPPGRPHPDPQHQCLASAHNARSASGPTGGATGCLRLGNYATLGISKNAVYDPAVSGAISYISYSEDTITGIWQIGAGLALQQEARLYFGGYRHDQSTSWTHHGASGLTAADFHSFSGNSLHPDFSSSGAPITFGFLRANSMDAGGPYGYTVTGGVDNWQLTITPIPEPITLVLLALSVAVVMGKGRRLSESGDQYR